MSVFDEKTFTVSQYLDLQTQLQDAWCQIHLANEVIAELSFAKNNDTEYYSPVPSERTASGYETEEHAVSALLSILQHSRWFTYEREVTGWYYGGLPFSKKETCRIDFVLKPTRDAVDAGWQNGIVGIECKKSHHKAGLVALQAMDYTRAIFRSTNSGLLFALSAVYVFPAITSVYRTKQGEIVTGAVPSLQSILTQNKVGMASINDDCLSLNMAGTNHLRLHKDGRLPHIRPILSGMNNGSR